ASVTVPSSKLRPATLCVPLTVTVKAPVASPPAEKTAVLPAAHAPVDDVPAELPCRKGLLPQVPAGVVDPAPPPEPLESQYSGPARADWRVATETIADASATVARRRRLAICAPIPVPSRLALPWDMKKRNEPDRR